MEENEGMTKNNINQKVENNTMTHQNQSINRISSETIQLEILKLLKELRDDRKDFSKRRRKTTSYDNHNSNVNDNIEHTIENTNNDSNNNRSLRNNNKGNNNNFRNNFNNQRQRNRYNNNNSNSQNNRPSAFARDVRHYCSTHGACNRESKECFRPGDNHNNNATFENKLGGSTANCKNQNK